MQNEESNQENGLIQNAEKPKAGIFKRLKGKNRYETMENYSICGVVFGTLVFAVGTLLTAFNTRGAPAVITMIGVLLSFLSSVSLVSVWFLKEMFLD